MDEKHFKILEFLSEQTTPVSYKDFPSQLQNLFPDSNTLVDGGLLMELQTVLKKKQWVETSRIFLNEYKITQAGINAFNEAKSETFEELVPSPKKRMKPFKQPVIGTIAISLFVCIALILITHYVFHMS